MIEHYNAFISYRHAPLDSKIAAHIQHSLEHFTIPDKIRKKTGVKRIQRVFRDKDELPITSNLSETISAALEDADFLIVICSHSTKESEWVRREIQYFLQHHSRDHVLTVLAEGDPYEVIPEELLSEEKTFVDKDGVSHTVRVPLEPLSCDYRLPKRQADKEELPRLAAPIIGCSYDELMNRRRAYRIRRLLLSFTLIFAVMLAFGAYMFRSSMKIRENYQQALKNQSLYLAHESEILLRSKHRTEAMLLAMAALPSKDKDRPVTAEAVRALTDATLAYKANDGFTINPIFTYSLPSQVSDFEISPEGSYLVAYDVVGNIFIWDTETYQLVLSLDHTAKRILDIAFYDEETLIIEGTDQILAIDPESGDEYWTYSTSMSVFYDSIDLCIYDSSVFVATFNNTIYEIDAESGEEINKIKFSNPLTDGSTMILNTCVLSPDGTKIAYLASDGFSDKYYGSIDLQSSETTIVLVEDARLMDIAWADADHFLVSSMSTDQSLTDTTVQGITVLNSLDMDVLCIDASDAKSTGLKTLWTSAFTVKGSYSKGRFFPIAANNEIAYYLGNTCSIYDLATGEIRHAYNAEDPIIDISDTDKNGEPLLITTKGCLVSPLNIQGKDALSVIPALSNSLSRVKIHNGFYSSDSNSCDIIYYNLYEGDKDFTAIDEDPILGSSSRSMISGDILAKIASQAGNTSELQIIDAKSHERIATVSLNSTFPKDSGTINFNLAGISNDTIYVIAVNAKCGTVLLSYDADEGELVDSVNLTEAYFNANLTSKIVDDKYAYINVEDKTNYLELYDVSTGKTETYELPDLSHYSLANVKQFMFFPDRDLTIFSLFDCDFFYDMEADKLLEPDFPESWTIASSADYSTANNCLAVTDGGMIMLMGKKGDPIEISCGGRKCIDVKFIHNGKKDILLALFDDNTMYRYDPSDGDFIGVSSLTIDNLGNDFEYILSADGTELFIRTNTTLSIVDIKSWYEIAVIPNCLGYCEASDSFYAISYINKTNGNIGYFRHYTVDELIQKATELCYGAQLSDAQKTNYGL